jgi:hypothetical protein
VFRSLAANSLAALPAPGALLRSLCALLLTRLSAALSAAGALCGIAGTALLAVDPDQVAPVFALYLGAAASWMGVGYLTRQRWLLASNVVYFALAVKGLLF